MVDIVIHCPHEIHKKPFNKLVDNELKEITPGPKILFIASPGSCGRFKIQCNDHRHRKACNNKAWMEIVLNGYGGYEVNELPLQRFKLSKVPCVVG